jgi:hypothetical protein
MQLFARKKSHIVETWLTGLRLRAYHEQHDSNLNPTSKNHPVDSNKGQISIVRVQSALTPLTQTTATTRQQPAPPAAPKPIALHDNRVHTKGNGAAQAPVLAVGFGFRCVDRLAFQLVLRRGHRQSPHLFKLLDPFSAHLEARAKAQHGEQEALAKREAERFTKPGQRPDSPRETLLYEHSRELDRDRGG